ncbi:ferredoxin--NADP reductase [Acidicapsa dinghuensis]|uniref:Ferredoxin--NADP reductase n=1 Tax=Acidicapsa dinghuensis TaxID=2218256 RepID=A0ABW1EIJ9_9BACT|nr:FAD-dependent oxidoreductase [Acidicapsa dinghuensis]
MPRQTYTASLLQKACISESAQCYHLEFQVDELPSFDFAPGQFVSTVAVDERGKTQTRAYSIASASSSNQFDLCVNRVEGGFFSNHLCDMEPGATVQVHGPHGNFTLRQPLTDSIFIATGTGIAPMRSFTQWLFPEQGEHAGEDRSEGKHTWLVYGTRHESELYYRDYFDRIAAEHENFHYVTTLSRAGEEWTGHRGYVQEYLGNIVESRTLAAKTSAAAVTGAVAETAVAVEELVEAQTPAFDIHTYICGLNNMVSAVRERLTGFGWHKKQIIFERYD